MPNLPVNAVSLLNGGTVVGSGNPMPVSSSGTGTVTGNIGSLGITAPAPNAALGSLALSGTVVAGTLIASPGTALALYIGSLQIGNFGTAAGMITLNDTAASKFIVPAGGGNNPPAFAQPLAINVGTALTATLSAATGGTVVVNAQAIKA